MASATGSLEFEAFRTHAFAPGIATLAFALAFFGFGAKAGMVPFHSWLPQAHPAAPSNVSALMSGGMISRLAGLYEQAQDHATGRIDQDLFTSGLYQHFGLYKMEPLDEPMEQIEGMTMQ